MSPNSLEKVVALLAIHLQEGSTSDALRLLQRTKTAFESKGALDTWLFWQFQALIAGGQPNDALSVARTVQDIVQRRFLEGEALRVLAQESGDWSSAIQYIENCYGETSDGRFLLELCQLQMHRQDWLYIANRSDELMNKVGTQDALRLAVEANTKVKRIDKCLDLLTTYTNLYPDNVLPSDLRRLKAWCQAQLGQLSKAVIDAQDLVAQDPSIANLKILMDVQLAKGDLKGVAITARQVIANDAATVKELLRTARIIMQEDHDLACRAWKRAISQEIEDPEDLAATLELGFRLGLEDEVAPLSLKAQALASQGKGPLKVARFSDFKAWWQTRAQNVAFITQKYDAAEIPIHFLAGPLDVTLSYIFHALPVQNRDNPDPQVQPPILIRHGGRPVEEKLAASLPTWKVHLDLTSLLLAADLEILDVIEDCFKPIRISKLLPAALVQQLDKLTPIQPVLLDSYRQVHALAKAGKFQPTPQPVKIDDELSTLTSKMGEQWVSLVRVAAKDEGFIVDYLPLTSNDGSMEPVELPSSLKDRVINCRSLVESLRRGGQLSESKLQVVLREMGAEGGRELGIVLPQPGDRIYLIANTADVLARASIMGLVCEHFQVYVDDTHLNHIESALEQDAHRSDLSRWIDALLARITSGLDRGIYEPMQLIQQQSAEPESIRDYSSLTFMELFQFPPQSGDVLCIDDRFANGHSNREGIPIISLLEILEVLRLKKKLTPDNYYDVLLRLRAANCRYIPLSRDEILYHLNQAQIVNGVLTSTEELLILRKYIASCLLDEHRLQRPPMPPGAPTPYGEMAFIAGVVRATSEAIVDGWEGENFDTGVAYARADWILKHLYVGVFGTRHLRLDPDPGSDGLDLIGLDIGGAVTRAIGLTSKRGKGDEGKVNRRKSYFDWLESRLLRPRLESDPEAKVAIGQSLDRLIMGVVERNLPRDHRTAQQILLQRLYLDMPESLQDELKSDPKLMAILGLRTIESVRIGNLVFQAPQFWRSVGKALRGKSSTVKAIEPKGPFVLEQGRARDSKLVTLNIRSKDGSIQQTFDEPILELLHNKSDKWETYLTANRHWFDCDEDTFKKIVSEILGSTEPQSRIEQVRHWRDRSAVVYYEALERSLRKSNQFKFDDLRPPAGDCLLGHYRLPHSLGGDLAFREVLENSAGQLVSEEGIAAALRRIICLPARLPAAGIDKIAGLSSEERESVIKTLSGQVKSPVCLVHLIYLVLKFDSHTEWGKALISKNTRLLFDQEEGAANFQLFNAILVWVNDVFINWADTKSWKVPVKLAMVWAHASRLHNIFSIAGAEPAQTAKVFSGASYRFSTEMFSRNITYWNDVLHPRRVERSLFITHGLSNALQDIAFETLSDTPIPKLIRENATIESEQGAVPNPLLIRDSLLALDNIGSLLGGDRWATLGRFVAPDLAGKFNSPDLLVMADEAIRTLTSNANDELAWIKLSAIVGDLPIYPELRDRTKSLLANLRLDDLLNGHETTAALALHFLSSQAAYILDESGRLQLREGLLRITGKHYRSKRKTPFVKVSEQAGEENLVEGMIIEALFELSVTPDNVQKSSREFSTNLRRFCEVSPNALAMIKTGISRMVFELPASHLHGIWPLVLYTRARPGTT